MCKVLSAEDGDATLCGAQCLCVALEKLGILDRDTGRVVLAAQRVAKEDIAGFYHGLLVYVDFSSGGSHFNTYGESIMKMMMRRF